MGDRQSDWMAVEWQEESLTVWIMAPDGAVKDRLEGATGSAGLKPDALEPVLGATIAAHLADDAQTDILIAGSPARPGFWDTSVAGRAVPCPPADTQVLTPVTMRDDRMKVQLVTGLTQTAPPALMLADSLRVAGFLAQTPGFDGVLCLSGARSHWVHVSAGEVVSFQTVLTQTLVEAALGALGIGPGPVTMGDLGLAAMEDVMSRPERIGQKIGSNAAQIALGKAGEGESREAILGAFIGLELASMKPYWLGQQVALVAPGALQEAYRIALGGLGLAPVTADAEEMLLAGFRAVRGL